MLVTVYYSSGLILKLFENLLNKSNNCISFWLLSIEGAHMMLYDGPNMLNWV